MKSENTYLGPVVIRPSFCKVLDRWEWEAVTVGVITTTHGEGYRSAEHAEEVMRRMISVGMMPEREIVVER